MQVMTMARAERPEGKAARLASRLRRDFQFLVFYTLPLLDEFRDDLEWMAEKVGLSKERAREYRDELVAERFWVRGLDGNLRTASKALGIGDHAEIVSAPEYLTMISHLLARISDDGPCWYESHVVVTSKALKLEFLSQVGAALKQFIESSQEAPGETVLAWAHVSVDSLKALSRKVES